MVVYLAISVIAYIVVFTGLGVWVATQCGRSEAEGATLGLLLGPFGILLEALLPHGKH